MQQTLHILKKDIRHLRGEIVLVVVAALLVVLSEVSFMAPGISRPGVVKALLVMAAVYLIAKVVHAEAFPGDRQFWLTRPYERQHLLAAKLLFVFLFVNMPLLLARLAILLAAGFPLSSVLPGLLWWQLLMFLAIVLPIAALAAMTEGLVSFIVSILFVWATGVFVTLVLDRIFGSYQAQLPPGMQWIQNGTLLLIAMAGAVAVLYLQYRRRRTDASRFCAACVVALCVLVPPALPMSLAMGVQSWFSRQRVDPGSIQVSLDIAPVKSERYPYMQTLTLRGIPSGLRAKAESYAFRIGPYGFVGKGAADIESLEPGTLHVHVASLTGSEILSQPVTAQGSVYLTLFGDPEVKHIAFPSEWSELIAGVQCSGDVDHRGSHLHCRTPFRWPAGLLYYGDSPDLVALAWPGILYSPFPVGLDFDAYQDTTLHIPLLEPIELTYVKPVAHLRVDFQGLDVRYSK